MISGVRQILKKCMTYMLAMLAAVLLPSASYAAGLPSAQQTGVGQSSAAQTEIGSSGTGFALTLASAANETVTQTSDTASHTAAQASGQIYVTADYGFGDDTGVKAGRYLPVTLHMDSRRTAGASGRVQVRISGSDADIYEYEYPWELAAEEQDDITYYVPLGLHSESMSVRVLLHDEMAEPAPRGLTARLSDITDHGTKPDGQTREREIYSRYIDLNMDTDAESLFIGTLCDEPDELSWLDMQSVNYGLLRTHIYSFDADTFPQDKRGLDMFDLVIVTGYRLRHLSETQMRAMLDWVRDGGVLLLGTGERADDTLGRLAPELLDDRYSQPELTELNISLGMQADNPSDGIIETMQVTVPLHGGSSVWRDGEYTLMSTVSKDSGAIAVASFDITQLSGYAAAHSGYADRFISVALTSSRVSQLAGESGRTGDDRYDYLSLLLGAGDVGKLPPVRLQAIAILAYILLTGPGLYIFLRQHAATDYYRRGVVVLAMVFAAFIYFIGTRTRFKEDMSGYVTVVTSDGASATETTFLSLRSPYAGAVTAETNGRYTVLPISSGVHDRTARTEDAGEESDVRITYTGENARIAVAAADGLSPRFFELERTLDEEDALKTVTGSLELFEGRLTGMLVNASGQRLTGVTVTGYGKVYYVGEMAAGETRMLTDVSMTNVPLRDSYNVAKMIYDDEDYEKIGIFTFLREYYLGTYGADLRVTAFAPDDGQEAISSDAGYTGTRVLVSLIPTDRRQGTRVCRPATVQEPLTVSGYYDAASNTMFTDGEVVLEYRLGEDIDPEELYIETVDAGFARFEGMIFWYDVYAAAYEPMEAENGLVPEEELSRHLTPEHTVTLRYVYTGDRKNIYEVSLPMISVIGAEE